MWADSPTVIVTALKAEDPGLCKSAENEPSASLQARVNFSLVLNWM